MALVLSTCDYCTNPRKFIKNNFKINKKPVTICLACRPTKCGQCNSDIDKDADVFTQFQNTIGKNLIILCYLCFKLKYRRENIDIDVRRATETELWHDQIGKFPTVTITNNMYYIPIYARIENYNGEYAFLSMTITNDNFEVINSTLDGLFDWMDGVVLHLIPE